MDFYHTLLSSEDHVVDDDLIMLIPTLITGDDNDLLMRPFTSSEVHDAIFEIPSNSSPGMDDFSAAFFQHSWELVKQTLTDVS